MKNERVKQPLSYTSHFEGIFLLDERSFKSREMYSPFLEIGLTEIEKSIIIPCRFEKCILRCEGGGDAFLNSL